MIKVAESDLPDAVARHVNCRYLIVDMLNRTNTFLCDILAGICGDTTDMEKLKLYDLVEDRLRRTYFLRRTFGLTTQSYADYVMRNPDTTYELMRYVLRTFESCHNRQEYMRILYALFISLNRWEGMFNKFIKSELKGECPNLDAAIALFFFFCGEDPVLHASDSVLISAQVI